MILCSMGWATYKHRGGSRNLKDKPCYGCLDFLQLQNGGFTQNHGFNGIEDGEKAQHSYNLWAVADLSNPVQVQPIIV